MVAAMPFTLDEDRRLREIVSLGVSVEFWETSFAGRSLSELMERRLDLGIRSAALL